MGRLVQFPDQFAEGWRYEFAKHAFVIGAIALRTALAGTHGTAAGSGGGIGRRRRKAGLHAARPGNRMLRARATGS